MGDMETPRDATKTVITPDGRELAYLDVGNPDGPLVIHNHGGPSSRLEAHLFAQFASRNRLRLVCVDRPGIGQSSPQKERTFAGWADDLTAVADALGYRDFGVTGWSEGGPWALAAAAYIDPARLRHVSFLSGASYGTFGDNSAAKYQSTVDAFGGSLALHFTPGLRLMYKALGMTVKRSQEAYFKQLFKIVNDYDQQLLRQPDVGSGFYSAAVECFAQGSEALVCDAIPLYRRWAFDVTAIDRPVHLWQGLDDGLVPDPINKMVADRMPGTVWHPVEKAGHLLAIGSGEEIFAIAAKELGA